MVTIQFKLVSKLSANKGLLSVDPSLLYHKARGTSGARPYKSRTEDLSLFLKKLAEHRVPTLRVLVSGATEVHQPPVKTVSHTRFPGLRPGTNPEDVEVILDAKNMPSILSEELWKAIQRVKDL